jgi:protein-disulfide isomerase
VKGKHFVLIAVAVAIVLFVAMKFMTPADVPPPPPPTAETSASAPKSAAGGSEFVRPHSPTLGNSLSRVIVVEWLDPECESCRVMHPILKKIVKDYGDRVNFVIRYMPYHRNSMYAASVLEEARELGKFEEAIDLLFEKQPEWGDHHQPRPELIPGYLATLGIPKENLEREAVIKKHGEKVEIDKADGQTVGVRGTPTFFVNGRMVQELGDQPIRAAIDAALAEAK